MESNGLGVRKATYEGAEPREGQGRTVLVEEADGRGSQRLGVVRRRLDGCAKLAFSRDRTQDLLVGRAAKQVSLDDVRDLREARNERRQPGRPAGMPEILRTDCRRGIRLNALRGLPGPRCVGLLA